ncbi:hypothetical protein KFK09_017775 [Dendrobium nobile]|uniref:Uncharacterized protein n=1 Tax=Dendrobium nobile TaxID=94219 RepID=A0A8T3ATD9_DENNO|nr:hypothetical protein KFK09_017775 [Dendrobium nobile]
MYIEWLNIFLKARTNTQKNEDRRAIFVSFSIDPRTLNTSKFILRKQHPTSAFLLI